MTTKLKHTKKYSTNKPTKRGHKGLRLAGLILLVVIVAASVLELTNTTYIFHKKPVSTEQAASSANTSVNKGEPTATAPVASTPSVPNSTKTGGTATASGVAPKQPYGNFVSSHSIPMSSGATSVCNTSPGATCTITFMKDSVSKSLVVTTTNGDGTAYWNWTPQLAGLSVGSWKITATATNGGQSTSVNDPKMLEVTP